MMLFFGLTWALAWYWIIVRAYDKWATYCENARAEGVKSPTRSFVKSLPAKIDAIVEETNNMFWFGG